MNWWQFVLYALQIAPQLIKLFQSLADHANAAMEQGAGRDQAVADALTQAAADLDKAAAATREAQAKHNANPNDDTGFDNQFRRD